MSKLAVEKSERKRKIEDYTGYWLKHYHFLM